MIKISHNKTIQSSVTQCSTCLHCGSDDLYRHGWTRRLQRYRLQGMWLDFEWCHGHTTFPSSYCKDKWLKYAQSMLWSETVRQAAEAVGVHRKERKALYF